MTTVEANTTRGPAAASAPASLDARAQQSLGARDVDRLELALAALRGDLGGEVKNALRARVEHRARQRRPVVELGAGSRVPAGADPGRRTSATTSCPCSRSCSHSTPPMKPLAPVTSARI